MKRIVVLSFLLLLSAPSFAQWRRIANFQPTDDSGSVPPVVEVVSSVYFLDLPGPPRIGFCGTESELWKTTNGGRHWTRSWGGGISADGFDVPCIFFKDSLTGWFVADDADYGSQINSGCYRTTNGGDTWTKLVVPNNFYGCTSVFYDTATNRLFLTVEWAQEGDTSGLRFSTDLGDSWQQVSQYQSNGIYFSNSQNGIVTTDFTDSNYTAQTPVGFLITTNGGLTWDTTHGYPSSAENILAIPGTPTLFAGNGGQIIVSRSDDFGRTWRILKDFGPYLDTFGNEIGPFSPGYIEGDLSRLYVQSDSGMFVSTDEGITWRNDGGPATTGCGCDQGFYAGNGIAIVGSTVDSTTFFNGAGLWEEIWPQSGVAESGAANSSTALSVFPNPATSSITVTSSTGPFTILDPLGRSYTVPTTPQPPPSKGGGVSLDISTLPSGVYFVSDGVSRAKFVKQ